MTQMRTDPLVYLSIDELAQRHLQRPRHGRRRPLAAYELRGLSQNGEDGVIAELLRRIGVTSRIFVEFGIESGREGNCVLLADVLAWSGLFIEADEEHFRRLSGKYAANPRVETVQASVAPDNIESLLREAAVPREFDVLSIDVDSADYWIWEAIVSHRPRIVVIEYNAALGTHRRAVQPRDHSGGWNGTDNYGASIAALEALGKTKGYQLVHTDMTGCNAFFVRADLSRDRFPTGTDVVRIGYPNFYLRGHEHPHDPAVERFVDPYPAGVTDPGASGSRGFSLAERVRLTYRHEGRAGLVRHTRAALDPLAAWARRSLNR